MLELENIHAGVMPALSLEVRILWWYFDLFVQPEQSWQCVDVRHVPKTTLLFIDYKKNITSNCIKQLQGQKSF